jgi:AcrR family transcriptional regulator
MPIDTTPPPTPERPLRADAARNRERILKAAHAVFAERGIAATLDDVADRAGVGVGTVYRRFPDKDALIDALFEDRLAEVVAAAEEATTHEDAWLGLTGFLQRTLELQAGDRGLRETAFNGRCGGDRVAQARARIGPVVTRLVERAQASGQLRPGIATSDMPMIQVMLWGIIDASREVSPDLWRRYLAIVLDGLRATPHDLSALPVAPLSLEQVPAAMHASQARRGRPSAARGSA